MSAPRGARLAMVLACGAPLLAGAQLAPGWQITGSNTLRVERYGSSGDQIQSPYQLGLGTMGYDEFNLNARLQDSPYSFSRFFVSGVVNESDYRSPNHGVVPERLNFTREDGEAAIPYRAEAGDFFAFTSLRTQQRSLKGLSVELQPTADNPAIRQSFIAFGGVFQQNYRGLQWGDDNSVGASWLLEHQQAGRVNVNVLRNERGANSFGASRRVQTLASVAGDTTLDAGGWKIRVEGEAAGIKGDHEFGTTPTEAVDKSDSGVFAQVSGFDARWNWRLRGERYGQDYRPFGATVQPNRRSYEGHVGYLFPGGISLRGRLQEYRDQLESPAPLDTSVAGVNLSGPLGTLGVNGFLDAYVQDLERTDGTQDSRFTNVNLSLSKAFANGWVGQLSLLRQESENKLNASLDSRTTQAQVSAIVPFSLGNWQGSVIPGVMAREVSGAFATRDWQPTLMLAAFGGPHRLTANFGRLDQDRRPQAATDVATVNFALDYRYRTGRHEFGVDWIAYDRDPSPGQSTEAYRVGLFYTYYFDASLAAPAAPAPSLSAPAAPLTAAGVTRSVDLLARLAPGADLEASVKALAEGGIAIGVRQPGAVVYETRLLGEIEQRQRLALAHSAGTVDRAVLIVSLDDVGSGDDAARTYERVRRSLLDRFGNPSFTFDEGNFGAAFAAELASGRLIRLTEWTTSSGIIRLGIPRRLDGIARLEVHHAKRYPSPRDTNWGLDSVR